MQMQKPTHRTAAEKKLERSTTKNHVRYILMAIVVSGGGLFIHLDVDLPNGQHLGIGSNVEGRHG
jgi:hypothetical protein